ncbi:hypothetical protein M413DRAFT_33103 [Hebeloma cylindrosporum]|uniref:F-box domain-containing protein n=1 Tax=Hebeloma cylindrosporum TaxID=76867 RepID=A0A0C3BTJ7_HEBCY|nr:hypothetical protein M413DRAFT_33103 [Hebeloma cylindrosporum h7]
MALTTDTESPSFPQEILELILDEVAALNSPQTLRACTLVSKSFYFPSRKHLYSHIFLVIDRHGQARARRLIKTLETLRKAGFAAVVHSLTLIFGVSSKIEPGSTFGSRILGRHSQKSKLLGSRIVEGIGLWETNLEKLLRLLMASQLTSFTLRAQGGFIDWGLHLKGEIRMETFHSLFTLPSLKSLHLSHVFGLDDSLVGEALQSNSLRELTLVSVSLPISKITQPVVQFTSRHIRSLDIRRTSITDFLSTMGYSRQLLSTPHPIVTFTRLQSLAISGRHSTSLDVHRPWKFILGLARTLETLEIEEVYWEGELI